MRLAFAAARTRFFATSLGRTQRSSVVTLAALASLAIDASVVTFPTSGTSAAGGVSARTLLGGVMSVVPHRIQYFRVGRFALLHFEQTLMRFGSSTAASDVHLDSYTFADYLHTTEH